MRSGRAPFNSVRKAGLALAPEALANVRYGPVLRTQVGHRAMFDKCHERESLRITMKAYSALSSFRRSFSMISRRSSVRVSNLCGDLSGNRNSEVVQCDKGLWIYSARQWREGHICPYLGRREGRCPVVMGPDVSHPWQDRRCRPRLRLNHRRHYRLIRTAPVIRCQLKSETRRGPVMQLKLRGSTA